MSELCQRAQRLAFSGDLILREHDGAEHRLVFRNGAVVDVRIRGHFDPILRRLFEEGSLDPEQLVRALEGLGQSRRRAGDLAMELGVPRRTLHRALANQGRRRFASLARIARQKGRDAWLHRREVRHAEVAFRLDVASLLRELGPPPAPAMTRAPPNPKRTRKDRRRALRRMAFALHPDRHQDLSERERADLSRRLAQLTARFHRDHDAG